MLLSFEVNGLTNKGWQDAWYPSFELHFSPISAETSVVQGRCASNAGSESIIVMISDECPECEADHMDIQAVTFGKVRPLLIGTGLRKVCLGFFVLDSALIRLPAPVQIAPIGNGRIDIQYRRVECTPPSTMVVSVDGNSGGGGWIRLSIKVSGPHSHDLP